MKSVIDSHVVLSQLPPDPPGDYHPGDRCLAFLKGR